MAAAGNGATAEVPSFDAGGVDPDPHAVNSTIVVSAAAARTRTVARPFARLVVAGEVFEQVIVRSRSLA